MKTRGSRVAKVIASALFVSLALFAGAILFGGPKTLPALDSINTPFKRVDFSDLAPLQSYRGDDGTALAYRFYGPSGSTSKGSVVLVHGSSASSNSMHLLAKAFAREGYAAYALDIRGHGGSGTKGRVGYVGQLEDDLDAFVRTVAPPEPRTLVGFSSGGGFALRFAGSRRQDDFQSYLLLSPFLGQHAPNARAGESPWVSVGLPRIVAIAILNDAGIRVFNDLPALRFALDAHASTFLTPEYSAALALNFGPLRDYEANIRAAHRPMSVVAGADDELFDTPKLEGIFRSSDRTVPVTLVPRVGHIALTLDPVAVEAAVRAVDRLNERPTQGS